MQRVLPEAPSNALVGALIRFPSRLEPTSPFELSRKRQARARAFRTAKAINQ